MKKTLIVGLLILVSICSAFASRHYFGDAGLQYSMSTLHFADTSSLLNEYGVNLRGGMFLSKELSVFGNVNAAYAHSIHNYQTFSRIPASVIVSVDAGATYYFDKINVSASAGLKTFCFGFDNPKSNKYMMVDLSIDAKYMLKSMKKTNLGVSLPLSFSFSKNGYAFSWGVRGNYSYNEVR